MSNMERKFMEKLEILAIALNSGIEDYRWINADTLEGYYPDGHIDHFWIGVGNDGPVVYVKSQEEGALAIFWPCTYLEEA